MQIPLGIHGRSPHAVYCTAERMQGATVAGDKTVINRRLADQPLHAGSIEKSKQGVRLHPSRSSTASIDFSVQSSS